MRETITASGGVVAVPALTAEQAINNFRIIAESMPRFSAVRGNIDFRPPHVRWAVQRERELRAYRRMWDWP